MSYISPADNNKAPYSEFQEENVQGGRPYTPPGGGGGRDYNRAWAGAPETGPGTTGRLAEFAQANIGNYLLFRAAQPPKEEAEEEAVDDTDDRDAQANITGDTDGPSVPSLGSPPKPGSDASSARDAFGSVTQLPEQGFQEPTNVNQFESSVFPRDELAISEPAQRKRRPAGMNPKAQARISGTLSNLPKI